MPRVTYTHPELAQVGATEVEARAAHKKIVVLRSPFSENDRAQAERCAEGMVKVVTNRRGRILGAGIVGPSAGELIHTWVLAMSRRMRVGALATMVAPYPTLGEANKSAAGSFYTESLFSERTRRIVRLLARLGCVPDHTKRGVRRASDKGTCAARSTREMLRRNAYTRGEHRCPMSDAGQSD